VAIYLREVKTSTVLNSVQISSAVLSTGQNVRDLHNRVATLFTYFMKNVKNKNLDLWQHRKCTSFVCGKQTQRYSTLERNSSGGRVGLPLLKAVQAREMSESGRSLNDVVAGVSINRRPSFIGVLQS